MDVFKDQWEKQVRILTEAVDDITSVDDFLSVSGIKQEKRKKNMLDWMSEIQKRKTRSKLLFLSLKNIIIYMDNTASISQLTKRIL